MFVVFQKGVYITIGEVMLRLDFSGAVHDPRRYNYVCRVRFLSVLAFVAPRVVVG